MFVPVYLFDVASRHMSWLSERQSVIAANVANADTPGYKAKEIAPFSSFVDGAALQLAATKPGHLTTQDQSAVTYDTRSATGWDTAHSGNNVSLERELMQSSATSRMMNMDTAVTRAFHRMILTSVKG